MKTLIVVLSVCWLTVVQNVLAGAPLVTTTGDGGAGSLRAALAAAADGDTIHFDGALA
jgi:hypothetical protein